MKEFIEHLISIWIRLFLSPVFLGIKNSNLKMRFIQKFMISFCKEFERNLDCYTSFLFRVKNKSTTIKFKKLKHDEFIAIVIQGPLIKEDDFTLNTVKQYLHCSDNVKVIVSTWNDEEKEYLERMEELGVAVVTSEKPELTGIMNVNYQLKSTQAGIKKALDLGCNYICKTRSDQRIYNDAAFVSMICMLKQYPVNIQGQKQRIIALTTKCDSLFKPYYISDFLYFGSSEDMKYFLEIPLDERRLLPQKVTCRTAVDEELIPEIYIIRQYLKTINANYENSVYDYWKFIEERMILIDNSLIGLYWPKYEYKFCEYIRNGTYDVNRGDVSEHNFDYLTWICLCHKHLQYKKEYEEYLDNEL